MKVTLESLLENGGQIVFRTKFGDMQPMLHVMRDAVAIEAIHRRLRRNEVALFKIDGRYALRRVIRVYQRSYLIRGDNTYYDERVPHRAAIGVMVAFYRKGKWHDVRERKYRRYVRRRLKWYPIRRMLHRIKMPIQHFWWRHRPLRHRYRRF